MTYNRTNWVNDSAPPISSENLNNIENGIVSAHAHIADKANPHETTPSTIGAASNADFTEHATDGDNPHDVKHAQTSPEGVAAGSDSVRNKHISNQDFSSITAHIESESNPHATKHGQTGPEGVSLSGADGTRDKHISDADATRWEAHVQGDSPHIGHETIAGAQSKVDAHALKDDNPHDVTAAQVGAPTSSAFDAHKSDNTHVTAPQRSALDNSTYFPTAENPVVTHVELQEVMAGGVRSSVMTLAELAAIPPGDRTNGDMRLVVESGKIYRFDILATSGEVKAVAGSGYWDPVKSAVPSHSDLTGLQGGSVGSQEYFHLTEAERDAALAHHTDKSNVHEVTAAQTGALLSINSITNAGGNIDIVYAGEDTQVESDATAKTVTITNSHNGKKTNPHEVTHSQTNPLGASLGEDTVRNKHISDKDFNTMNDHMQAGSAHGSTSSFTPGTIMQRDGEGRAQVTAPVDPLDIATKNYVDTQLGTGVFYPEPNTLMRRDENGRTQVAAPSLPEDAVNKETLDAALDGLTQNHNDLTGIQGGTGAERYHLTEAQHTVATTNGLVKMNGGTNSFVGNDGERSFAHGLGAAPKTVQITPIASSSSGTGGLVGEFWYRANATTIWVGNTGSSTGSFGWLAML